MKYPTRIPRLFPPALLAATVAVSAQAQTAPPFHGALSIREHLTAPLTDVEADGGIWVRTREFRAHLDRDGLAVYPAFGKQSPREWPVRFDAIGAFRGGAPLAADPGGAPTLSAGRMELSRGGFREVYELGLDTIEQTFADRPNIIAYDRRR